MPMPEATVATSNSLVKSGSRRTGAVVREILICWKARSAAALHLNWVYRNISVNGVARELKSWTKER